MLWLVGFCFIVAGMIFLGRKYARQGPEVATAWVDNLDRRVRPYEKPVQPGTDHMGSSYWLDDPKPPGNYVPGGATQAALCPSPPRGEVKFLPPIPVGYQIYEGRLSVAGVQFCHADALRFAGDGNQSLSLQREPDNPRDPNAIRVIGGGSRTRAKIGYVPRHIAQQIVKSGCFNLIQPRLDYIWCSGDGYVDIVFQIIGPKERKVDFDDAPNREPAHPIQKELLKFIGAPVSKGLNVGQAAAEIAGHRRRLESENTALLDEWDAYEEILNEFADPEFRASFDLKKVSASVLRQATKDLQNNGETMRSMVESIDLVVTRIIELKPDLERRAGN